MLAISAHVLNLCCITLEMITLSSNLTVLGFQPLFSGCSYLILFIYYRISKYFIKFVEVEFPDLTPRGPFIEQASK